VTTVAKTVLVTGASSGIGQSSAIYFRQKGWNVAATMRYPEKHGDRVTETLICPRLDVTAPATITSAIAETLDKFGRIDVLVNNAGYGLTGALESLSIEQIRRQYETNVFGLIIVTQSVLPTMRSQRAGTIINVSSIGGRLAFPFCSAYHSTKWAVEGLSEALRFELRPFGIEVKLIEPGGIRTDFGDRNMETVLKPPYDVMANRMLKMYESRANQLPEPEGVARIIFKAATDRSARLRYPVHHFPYLLMRQVLPDFLWRRLLRAVVDPPIEL
jgi:NAD(P)-dependent dehydrogenase (short-subunit alcohol dehydrogenase family)